MRRKVSANPKKKIFFEHTETQDKRSRERGEVCVYVDFESQYLRERGRQDFLLQTEIGTQTTQKDLFSYLSCALSLSLSLLSFSDKTTFCFECQYERKKICRLCSVLLSWIRAKLSFLPIIHHIEMSVNLNLQTDKFHCL